MKIEIKEINKKIQLKISLFLLLTCYYKIDLIFNPWPMGTVCTVPYHYSLLVTIHWWKN